MFDKEQLSRDLMGCESLFGSQSTPKPSPSKALQQFIFDKTGKMVQKPKTEEKAGRSLKKDGRKELG